MLADYHVHTEFSDDSYYLLEDVVKDALAMGFEELCITDHVDYGVKFDQDANGEVLRRVGKAKTNVYYPRYAQEIARVQRLYAGKIAVKMGMEFGVQTHTIPRFEALFSQYPFDFIILSIHQVGDKEFWTYEYQEGKTQQQYNEGYYEELLRVVKAYKNYSVLGHMDLIKRYDKAGAYPFEKVKPMIAEILKVVIADGKGIEVNTSSHRYKVVGSTPSADILQLYKDLGGCIVTIGSDSHAPAHLGAYIKEAQDQLRGLGFTQICTFDKMLPIFHAL